MILYGNRLLSVGRAYDNDFNLIMIIVDNIDDNCLEFLIHFSLLENMGV